MFPSLAEIVQRLLVILPVLLLSLTVHEYAHAWAARRLGDDTAERMGRYTLNPLAHIDPIGTFLLPVFTNIPFGWAKPVPVNPARFRQGVNMGKGMMFTSLAGPASNVLLGLLVGGPSRVRGPLLPGPGGRWGWAKRSAGRRGVPATA